MTNPTPPAAPHPCECGSCQAQRGYFLTTACCPNGLSHSANCICGASICYDRPVSPEAAPPRATHDSGTYGELPPSIRRRIVGHEWDNMTRDEQRAWLIRELVEADELYEADHG